MAAPVQNGSKGEKNDLYLGPDLALSDGGVEAVGVQQVDGVLPVLVHNELQR